jgi:signal transduction histidine kinase/DNA-binding response OmpR family regulator
MQEPGLLIISSDPVIGDSVAASDHASGMRVAGTTPGAGATELIASGEYGVVLVDADELPGGPAYYILDLRRRNPDAVVLVAATEPSRELLIELLHTGVYDFFLKPMSPADICSAVYHIYNEALAQARKPDKAQLSREVYRANRQLVELNETLRQHVSEFTILYQMGRDISGNENWSDALDRFLMELVKCLDADGAALLLFSDEEQRLAIRTNFQVDPPMLSQSCQVLLQSWKDNPRGEEIHPVESYREGAFTACLDRSKPWKFTAIPLRHRNRPFGFLLIEKLYRPGRDFKANYHFLNTLRTILGGEVANAAYISELRQLGRFNHKVLDNITSGVVTTDLEGNVRFSNEHARRLCPQIMKNDIVAFDSLFRSSALMGRFYDRLIHSSKDTHVFEVDYIGVENTKRPARLSITRMHDEILNGAVLVAIFEDLAEQKQLEREIRRNDRLRVLGQLSAGVAHEIRNPLTGIATSVEVLGTKVQGDEDKSRYITVILDEIRRLDEIIRNLLTFARPPKPQMNDMALSEIPNRVITLLSEQARKKGVELGIVDELEDDRCHADADLLTQVLLNLTVNSIQACRRGDAVKIQLSNESVTSSSGQGCARIDVIDSGVGVPHEVRSSLFDPFVTTKTHGTGLGLAISQQIIEEHRGEIVCEFLEKGTRFTVRLPVGDPVIIEQRMT